MAQDALSRLYKVGLNPSALAGIARTALTAWDAELEVRAWLMAHGRMGEWVNGVLSLLSQITPMVVHPMRVAALHMRSLLQMNGREAGVEV